jgi:hypothetical protein
MSPDQRLLVYASISPVAFVVNVGSSYDVVGRDKHSGLVVAMHCAVSVWTIDSAGGVGDVSAHCKSPSTHQPYDMLVAMLCSIVMCLCGE